MRAVGSFSRAWVLVLWSIASSLRTSRPVGSFSALYAGRGMERIQTDYGVVQLPNLDFLTPGVARDNSKPPNSFANSAVIFTQLPNPSSLFQQREADAIVYLEQELRLPEQALTKIVLKYPWILYLKVESNLIPTVQVFRSFGFRDRDVRSIVAQTPSVLAINHMWTLPEKLLSLQVRHFILHILLHLCPTSYLLYPLTFIFFFVTYALSALSPYLYPPLTLSHHLPLSPSPPHLIFIRLQSIRSLS
jgi:hypothetical protein